MAFNFPAVTYIIALIGDAFLIFFSIFHVIAFDELKTDYKNPIDQCNSLNPVSIQRLHHLNVFQVRSARFIGIFSAIFSIRLRWCAVFRVYKLQMTHIALMFQLVIPEYLLHLVFNILFLLAGEWLSLLLNAPLIAYHVFRWVFHWMCKSHGRFSYAFLLMPQFRFRIVQVQKSANHEWTWIVRPDEYYECR